MFNLAFLGAKFLPNTLLAVKASSSKGWSPWMRSMYLKNNKGKGNMEILLDPTIVWRKKESGYAVN